MGFLLGLIRAVFIAVGFLILMVFAAAVTLVGGLFMLLSGRRPQIRVIRPQDLGGPFYRAQGPFQMPEDPFYRPPMKDVTPHPVGEIQSSRE